MATKVEAFLEYDEDYSSESNPFVESDQALPFSKYLALKHECDQILLDILKRSASTGPPAGISPWVSQELDAHSRSKSLRVQWFPCVAFREILRGGGVCVENLNISAGLLICAMESLAREVGADRVRLVFLTYEEG